LAPRGRIFVSYRREDAAADARGIFERLVRAFGASNVFMDVDRLMAGQRFERELDNALGKCDVLIAVIGSRWMALLEEYATQGRRDYVREEIAAALQKDMVIVPVLVGREAGIPALPSADKLPENIRDLVAFQKVNVAHETFRRDTDDLMASLRKVLRSKYGPATPWRAIAAIAMALIVIAAGAIGYWKGILPVHRLPAATQEEATRKANEAQIVTDCDRLAAAPQDNDRPNGIAGVYTITEVAEATAACDDAMRRYPDIARFVYQAGRAAASGGDYARGIQLLRAAIAMNSTPAFATLGALYLRGEGVPHDYVQARRLFEDGARRGDSNAIANLGNIYRNGLDVSVDYAKARELYEQGVTKGSPAAMVSLGGMYETGQGIRLDYGAAHDLYQRAASLGHAGGMTGLGNLYYGGLGVPQEYSTALSWFQKAAALGDGRAMGRLGLMYDLGQGVPSDPAQARQWFAKAAGHGGPYAMFYLGTLNEAGRGGPKDIDKAREWYQKALIAGYEPAREKLKNLNASGASSGSPQ
jgi:uncharacterized protein